MNRTAANWAALAAGTVLALAASAGAYQLAQYSWAQVVDYRSPYVLAPVPETAEPPSEEATLPATAGEPRLVFITIDGLRADVSRKMPTLNSLRDRGYDAVVRTEEPSLSGPTWTTLFSGAPPQISGVTTNWFEGRVPVETLFDVAVRTNTVVAVSAPTDFEKMYGVKRFPNVLLRDWEKGTYMTGEIVDGAISLAKESSATLIFVHSPDIDEAGHAAGGASKEYLDTALKIDRDLGRLVSALQDERTTFVVASDHGHTDSGGHGGWEAAVKDVPVIVAGSKIALGEGHGTQEQVAPTVALLAQLPAPRHAMAVPLPVVVGVSPDSGRFAQQQIGAFDAYSAVVTSKTSPASKSSASARVRLAAVTEERAARERTQRLGVVLALTAVALAVLAAIGTLSWRALVATLTGTVFYYLVYNALFFLIHGYGWTLSAFNSEELLKSFFNGRMVDAVIAGVLAALVAGEVYLALHTEHERPRGEYLPGWLALGTATALTIQATLALQVAWFLWSWGAQVTWRLPDFMWGFKYDLDLIQGTALASVAVVAPLVTWLIGRYHPIRARSVVVSGPASSTTAGGSES